jgi:tRNA(Arg) A34 adenosine deaminase TadA
MIYGMMSAKEQRIYSLCLDETHNSTLLYRHACIATRGGKIYKRGVNNHNTRIQLYMDKICTCHAEVDVLHKIYFGLQKKHKLNKIFRKVTLYITRNGDNNSAPCIDCLKVIKKLNIKKIIFKLNEEYYVLNPQDYETSHMSRCQAMENEM